ncbi:hypothetical protein M446_3507 [Methylobacterium sp. 4-46]|nr:hypothetical protein M446_3507 [Methylobacterium sp. 4-46]
MRRRAGEMLLDQASEIFESGPSRVAAGSLAPPVGNILAAIIWGGFFAGCAAVVLCDLRLGISDHPRTWLLLGWGSFLIGTQFGPRVRTR